MDQSKKLENHLKVLNQKKPGFSIINRHLNVSIDESENVTKKLIENITYALSLIEENKSEIKNATEIKSFLEREEKISEILTESLTLLEFQDILAQRLKKISEFLLDIKNDIENITKEAGIDDGSASKITEEIKRKLEELEWKKEVKQDDVDEILKEYGM